MNRFTSVLSLLITMLGATVVSPAIAQPRLEFNSETPDLKKTLSLGQIRVEVDYDARENSFNSDLRYVLYHRNQAQLQDHQSGFMFGSVELRDLNRDTIAEAIVTTYSGGAHCCTTHEIYQWTGDTFEQTTLGPADGNGGTFRDLDGDGVYEFLSFNGSFLYAFSSYAGSFPPSRILRIGANGAEDVTRDYPEYLRGIAWQMYQGMQNQDYEINGILAGYVAQKILLGEFEEGWKLMLARYDRTSDWGLDVYNNAGEVIYQHPDFPTALRAFLTEQGYLE